MVLPLGWSADRSERHHAIWHASKDELVVLCKRLECQPDSLLRLLLYSHWFTSDRRLSSGEVGSHMSAFVDEWTVAEVIMLFTVPDRTRYLRIALWVGLQVTLSEAAK